jgi:hypothetical protein
MIGAEKLSVYKPTPLAISDFSGIRAALDRDGVCVVRDVLTTEEQSTFLHLFWHSIEKRHATLKRTDPSTWTEDNTDWYGTFGAGQYKHYGMAQEEHCWLIRKNPAIRRVFEDGVYGTNSGPEECCVSLDGCAALFRPTVSGLKLHVDQVPGLLGDDFGSVQGAYNLYAVEADEARACAGFVCVVGSHRKYDEMWRDRMQVQGFKVPKKHWHVLEADSPLQKEASLILSPANSMVIWKSTLLHKNYGGDYTATDLGSDSDPRLCRLTQFITFMPKRFRTEGVLLKKAKAVVDGCSTNHWAALAFRVPTVPFPAWSAAAKAIPVIAPSFLCTVDTAAASLAAISNGNGRSDSSVEHVSGKKRDRESMSDSAHATKPSNKKEKQKKGFQDLPKSIRELL